ncbi:MAG: C45 family autoproteolytic acyltransferase/hydrolase [Candidatus Hydrogenedentes bacterium]|nr:C45 family autoproteolytic acyltransferase/hydrolase [Candidatus Hydrogenedentota bacterium]
MALSEVLSGCILTDNDYYRAGRALGTAYKTGIRMMLRQFILEFPQYLQIIRDEGPAKSDYMPVVINLDEIQKGADPDMLEVLAGAVFNRDRLAQALYDQSPNNYYKLLGIADGAFGPYMRKFLFSIQCLEVTMPRLSYINPGLCSAVLLRSSATTFGEPVLAKSFDLLNVCWYGCVTRKTRPGGKLPSLDNTLSVLPGAVSTLNPYFCVTHNTLPGAFSNGRYLPGTCTEQDMTEACRSVEEAIEFLYGTENGGYFLFPMADAEDNIALVESTPFGKEVIVPDADFLVVTNHSQCPHPHAPDGAVRTDIPLDTFIRHRRLTDLVSQHLAKNGKLSLENIKAMFADHEHGGGLNSLCRHSSIAGTVSTVIMLPKSGRMLVAPGHPCETPFLEYEIE